MPKKGVFLLHFHNYTANIRHLLLTAKCRAQPRNIGYYGWCVRDLHIYIGKCNIWTRKISTVDLWFSAPFLGRARTPGIDQYPLFWSFLFLLCCKKCTHRYLCFIQKTVLKQWKYNRIRREATSRTHLARYCVRFNLWLPAIMAATMKVT